jgi:hypothetical protein
MDFSLRTAGQPPVPDKGEQSVPTVDSPAEEIRGAERQGAGTPGRQESTHECINPDLCWSHEEVTPPATFAVFEAFVVRCMLSPTYLALH